MSKNLTLDEVNPEARFRAEKIVHWYESVGPIRKQLTEEFFEHSGFLNFGFWRADTRSAKDASINLMEEIVSGLSSRETLRVLDVGCGIGATTQYLANRFGAHNVTGINIAAEQLSVCRERIPECNFLRMDAANLEFEDRSFDLLVSVEAAFHFFTRKAFLDEAYRVLKPGGRLVLADMLLPQDSTIQPSENWLPDVAAYRATCEHSGFQDVEIRDITSQSWVAFLVNARRFLAERIQAGAIRPGVGLLWHLWARSVACQNYLLVRLYKQ